MSVNVGMVGLGFMGKMHASVYAQNPDVRIAAFCDANPDLMKKESFTSTGNIAIAGLEQLNFENIKCYTSYDEMLEDETLDVIDICLPTDLHKDFAVKAFSARKHVICEKPIALTLDEAAEMIRTAHGVGKYLCIAQCIRFWPEYVWLKQTVDENRYGAVKAAFFRRVGPLPDYSAGNWSINKDRGGEAAMDMHIHDVDVIQFIFGKPESVFSCGTPVLSDGMDFIVTQYRYASVPSVTSMASWGSPESYPFNMSFTVLFEKATAEFNIANSPALNVYKVDGTTEQPEVESGDGYSRELGYFIECIQNNTEPTLMMPESARYSLELTLQEIASARSGLN